MSIIIGKTEKQNKPERENKNTCKNHQKTKKHMLWWSQSNHLVMIESIGETSWKGRDWQYLFEQKLRFQHIRSRPWFEWLWAWCFWNCRLPCRRATRSGRAKLGLFGIVCSYLSYLASWRALPWISLWSCSMRSLPRMWLAGRQAGSVSY